MDWRQVQNKDFAGLTFILLETIEYPTSLLGTQFLLIWSHCGDSSQFDMINFLKNAVEIGGEWLIFKRQGFRKNPSAYILY